MSEQIERAEMHQRAAQFSQDAGEGFRLVNWLLEFAESELRSRRAAREQPFTGEITASRFYPESHTAAQQREVQAEMMCEQPGGEMSLSRAVEVLNEWRHNDAAKWAIVKNRRGLVYASADANFISVNMLTEFESVAIARAYLRDSAPAWISVADRQRAVWQWCQDTFEGIAAWDDVHERAFRFFEEAAELFQACGMQKKDALDAVDYVFGRPVGEVSQEIGGVMITLLALAAQQNQSVEGSMSAEYQRIMRPETQAKIREKQRSKQLVGSYLAEPVPAPLEAVEEHPLKHLVSKAPLTQDDIEWAHGFKEAAEVK